MNADLPTDLVSLGLVALPLVLLLYLLVFRRWKAGEAGAIGMLLTLVIAALAFRTPLTDLAVASAKGAWDSVYILYIIWPALLLYLIGKNSGAFDALGHGITRFSRNELFLILGFGWVFASFMQGIAGFGTPIAVTAPLLVAIGVRPVYAVVITLIGHAWANMFGTLAVSWIATQQVVALDNTTATAFQTALLLWIPNLTAGLMIAWLYGRGAALRHALPLVLIISLIQGGGQLLLANVNAVISNFIPATLALVALYPLSRWKRYREPARSIQERRVMEDSAGVAGQPNGKPDTVMSIWMALMPYGVLIVVALSFLLIPPLSQLVTSIQVGLPFPAIETGYGVTREALSAYSPLQPFNHPGFFVLITALIAWIVFRARGYFTAWQRRSREPGVWSELLGNAVPSSIAVMSFLVMSRVLDHSGQTTALALGIEQVTPPVMFAFVSNGIGVLGAFMTSSNTASNVLFANLQSTIAKLGGIPQATVIAAQSTGGAIGNAIAPANALLGTSTTNIVGQEGDVLRITLVWTVGVAILTGLATVLLYSFA